MKGVKKFYDGVENFRFVSMLLSFTQLTSRVK